MPGNGEALRGQQDRDHLAVTLPELGLDAVPRPAGRWRGARLVAGDAADRGIVPDDVLVGGTEDLGGGVVGVENAPGVELQDDEPRLRRMEQGAGIALAGLKLANGARLAGALDGDGR